jgi:riboflavin synthase
VTVEVDPSLAAFMVEKGSVTVDGISLTVVWADLSSFEVALVPHTLEVTTLGRADEGRTVNVEVDVLAKYVQRLLVPYGAVAAPAPGDDPGYL